MSKKNKHPKPQCSFRDESGSQCKAYCTGEYQYCIGHAKKLNVWKSPDFTEQEVAKSIAAVGKEIAVTERKDEQVFLVGEPVALQAMREQTESEIARRPVDPRDKLQVIDQIRQLMGMAGLTVDDFGGLAEANQQFQHGEQKVDEARQRLIDRARSMSEQTPPQTKAIAEQKAMADVQRVAQGLTAQKQMTAMRLKSEPWVEVMGGVLPEEFSINGVGFTIPANGLYRVPSTIARMLTERRLRKQEKNEKAALMSADHPLEYGELQRRMKDVERKFGSLTIDEGSEFSLAAEEIKAR